MTSLHKFAFCQRQKYQINYCLHTTTFIDNSYSTEDTICKIQLLCYGEVSSLETCLNILINIPMTCLHLGNVGTSVKLSLETLQCSVTPPSCGFSNWFRHFHWSFILCSGTHFILKSFDTPGHFSEHSFALYQC